MMIKEAARLTGYIVKYHRLFSLDKGSFCVTGEMGEYKSEDRVLKRKRFDFFGDKSDEGRNIL